MERQADRPFIESLEAIINVYRQKKSIFTGRVNISYTSLLLPKHLNRNPGRSSLGGPISGASDITWSSTMGHCIVRSGIESHSKYFKIWVDVIS